MSKRKQNTITMYTNGATARMHNKRVSFINTDENVIIKFEFADFEANKPACIHKCHRGKVRETDIQMSIQAMDALVLMYTKHKQALAIDAAKTTQSNSK